MRGLLSRRKPRKRCILISCLFRLRSGFFTSFCLSLPLSPHLLLTFTCFVRFTVDNFIVNVHIRFCVCFVATRLSSLPSLHLSSLSLYYLSCLVGVSLSPPRNISINIASVFSVYLLSFYCRPTYFYFKVLLLISVYQEQKKKKSGMSPNLTFLTCNLLHYFSHSFFRLPFVPFPFLFASFFPFKHTTRQGRGFCVLGRGPPHPPKASICHTCRGVGFASPKTCPRSSLSLPPSFPLSPPFLFPSGPHAAEICSGSDVNRE